MTIITHSYAILKRETNTKFARRILLDTYRRLNGNVAATARSMQCNRRTVYLALVKQVQGDLADLSHAPRHVPNKSPTKLEKLILKYRKKTRFGKRRLHNRILQMEDQLIPESTIGAILKRHQVTNIGGRRVSRSKRPPSYNLESLLPFEQCQLDTKEIADAQTLPGDVYNHFLGLHLPRWQWTFMDVRTRIRFLAWSYQCSWGCGQVFVSLVRWWLASFGFTWPSIVRIDGGREWHANFRGAFERSLDDFYHPLLMFPELIRKGHPEDNGYVERSHGTDDTELYIPWLQSINNERQFMDRMAWWQKVYNLVRSRSGVGMDDLSPYEKLRQIGLVTPSSFVVSPTLILDRLTASPTVFKQHHSTGKGVQDHVDYDQSVPVIITILYPARTGFQKLILT